MPVVGRRAHIAGQYSTVIWTRVVPFGLAIRNRLNFAVRTGQNIETISFIFVSFAMSHYFILLN